MQRTLFKDSKIGTVNITGCGNALEKNYESQNVRLDPELKEWVNDIAVTRAEALGNSKYGASSLIRDAIKFYRDFYHVHKKALRHKEAIVALLEKLH